MQAAWHWKVFGVLVSIMVLGLAVIVPLSPLFGGALAWGR
jgi:hypothetical protein